MSVGLCGIYNLGNTCYINSILQCLSNVPAFRDILLGEEYTVHHQSRTQGQLVEALAGFMTSMWSINSLSGTVLNPKNIRTALQVHTRKFDGAQQQDAQEFLLYLLAAISEETKLNNQSKSLDPNEDHILLDI
uniref:ubiquitinyl hydrolase 1 n=1 Tax=Cacopsylla melanoneura TaxID=428564 RepID=A0A8D8SW01_9HEMI